MLSQDEKGHGHSRMSLYDSSNLFHKVSLSVIDNLN